MPQDYCLVQIEIPEDSIFEVKKLPKSWNAFPHTLETQKIGDKFSKERKFLALKVPSAAVQGEFNYLLNPYYKDFDKVKVLKIEAFSFDKRLFLK